MTSDKGPAAAYYRMSTAKDEQKLSVEHQRRAVEEYAKKHGYRIVAKHVYVDERVGGDDTERRREFRRMLDDAKRGGFKWVLCFDRSRFGRFNLLDAGYWTKPLRDAGVKLVTKVDGPVDWSSFAGQLTYGLGQGVDEGELRKKADFAADRMPQLIADGGWPNAAPYGYKIARRHHPNWSGRRRNKDGSPADDDGLPYLVPDEATAEAAREVLRRWGLEGATQGQIAASLNDRGVPSPAAGRCVGHDDDGNPILGRGLWSQSMVRLLLLNEAYAGKTVYGRGSRSKYFSLEGGEFVKGEHPTKALRHNAPGDRIVRENTHEALADAETWAAVCRRFGRCGGAGPRGGKRSPYLEERRRHSTPHKGGGGFLFTGLLVCGHCGYRMHGLRWKRNGGEGRGYFCSGYAQCGRSCCRRRWVNEELLADEVKTSVWHDLLLGPGKREALEARLRRLLAEHHGPPADVAKLRRELEALRRKVAVGYDRYLSDEGLSAEMRKDLARRLEALKAQEKVLKAKVEEAEQGAGLRETVDERVRAFIDRLTSYTGDFAEVRKMIAEVRCRFEDVGERGSRLLSLTVRWDVGSLLGDLLPELSYVSWPCPEEVKSGGSRPCGA
jgi:DNA invertase Pin-like site-specific DNA recombinase